MANQASSLELWRASSSAVTSLSPPPPLPVRSVELLVSLIQSMRDRPGFRAVLFLGLPDETSDIISETKTYQTRQRGELGSYEREREAFGASH